MSERCITPWRIILNEAVSDYSESIFALGNGCLGARGFSLQTAKRFACDHSIFKAGFFEPIKPGVTDMVQLPDVLGLRIVNETPQEVSQVLDMRKGVLTQHWSGDRVRVETDRMVSMADSQLICVRLKVTALVDTAVTIKSVMDANVSNLPISDDQTLTDTQTVRLLETVARNEKELVMRALHSGRTLRFLCNTPAETCVTLKAGEVFTLEKRVRVLLGDEAPNAEAADPWQTHTDAWAALWRDCDIELDADERIQGAVRYNIFQLLCNNDATNPNVSIGARGLTHGRYKGNTFWDTDIFLLPFYCWQRPKAARNLVLYRLKRLEDAKALARQQNLNGARYPWMCAADGAEQCESWDIGLCETHITADVAYAADRYATITGDESLEAHSAEMYLETARYWRSRLNWEEGKKQFSSFFVKGPDEYCGAAVNNTYTNYMARHNVQLALRNSVMDEKEREKLTFFKDHIALLYDPVRSLYLQDELFERLEPMPVASRDGSPLYKTVCFDRIQRYRALKQADLVQLMTLFPHSFTPEQQKVIWETYEPLTVHDSSLSWGVHAHLAFLLDMQDKAWNYFERSLLLDLEDGMHNTGREGIHVAALGASWQALVYGALGLWSENGELTTNPHLPKAIRRISMCVYHHGERLRITADPKNVSIVKEA